MAYSYDFKDNVVYGADHINAIRASLMTKGVIEESSESCKVVVSENGVTVGEGQAIFSDGCCIKVDSDGVEREIISGTVNYVYFYNNTLAGVCEVMTATTSPEGDYVLLAEVDAEGNLTDKREFAQMKTADAERYAASFSGALNMTDNMAAGEVIGEIALPKSNCSYLEFNFRFASEIPLLLKLFPKEDGYVIWQYANGLFYSGDTFSITDLGKTREFKFEVSGNVMTVRFMSISTIGTDSHDISISGVCMR